MVAGAEDITEARYDMARVSRIIQSADHDDPLALFRPDTLRRTARRFLRGFPGMVSYAVKANPSPEVLRVACTVCFTLMMSSLLKSGRARHTATLDQ